MKTVFFSVLGPPPTEKALALKYSVSRLANSASEDIYHVSSKQFASLSGSPFAYWCPNSLLAVFKQGLPVEPNFGLVRVGAQTDDDYRFVRLTWETPKIRRNDFWRPFLKGGQASPFYSDISATVNWRENAAELKAFVSQVLNGGHWSRHIFNCEFYGRPGVSWALRTARFAPSFVPSGCIPSVSRYLAIFDSKYSEFFVGIASSTVFDALCKMKMERFEHPKFIVGVVKDVPIVTPSDSIRKAVGRLAVDAWRLLRRIDSQRECSHAFVVPALVQVPGATLRVREQVAAGFLLEADSKLAAIKCDIDNHAFELFSISTNDRARIGRGFGGSSNDDDDSGESQDEVDVDVEADLPRNREWGSMVVLLLSWSVGVAFGRFDVRFATGERAAPPEPEPFDPLPVCSPGMLTGEDGLPLAAAPLGYPLTFPTDGILVDDPGHQRDLVHAVRSVFDVVFEDANARWHEAAEILETPDLRVWLAGDFFEPHIKRYSKSRRKAPIYWQFATASGSYSVWLYIHRATSDTLFRVLNEFVEPKLEHEKAKLDEQTQEFGPNPSSSQRRELERQESLVGELQALKIEVARVAPLWKPNLDDGVILNFAPLWRLVPQNKAWQTECKKAWDRLQAGDYDWAHLAMHLWPERVVHKCMEDRSLAIAHGLEDVFWYEDDSETWQKSLVGAAEVHRLIQERSSPTVKAALKDLLSAQAPAAAGRRATTRAPAVRAAAPAPSPGAARSAAREAGAESAVDEATLAAVRGAIGKVVGGASKADVLEATGISEGEWNKVIAALLERGEVTRTGQKRGTRYHSPGGPHA